MTPVPGPWTQFLFCVALIGLGGPELSRSAEIIARRTGLSRGWVGVVLLATVTSLPELVTGLAAVVVAGAPDLAAGDVFGSCVFNLALLGVLDIGMRRYSIFSEGRGTHVQVAAFGALLIAIALVGSLADLLPAAAIGPFTPMIVVAYVVAMRRVAVAEGERARAGTNDDGPTLALAVVRYVAAALVVAAAGIWLALVGEQIAEAQSWQQSFVGTLLMAAATSLPEIVVSAAAVRAGALEAAVGNLLGSNLFNVVLLALDDLAYGSGSFLSAISPMHAVSAAIALLMTAIVLVQLLPASPRGAQAARLRPGGMLLLALYLLNGWLMYAGA